MAISPDAALPKNVTFLFFGLSPVAESERYSNRIEDAKWDTGIVAVSSFPCVFFQDDLEHSCVKLNKTGGNSVEMLYNIALSRLHPETRLKLYVSC